MCVCVCVCVSSQVFREGQTLMRRTRRRRRPLQRSQVRVYTSAMNALLQAVGCAKGVFT